MGCDLYDLYRYGTKLVKYKYLLVRMIQAHGLSHHGGQTGLVSSRAICRSTVRHMTPVHAQDVRMPYGISPWPRVEVFVLRISPYSVLLRVCSTRPRDFSRGCASIEKNGLSHADHDDPWREINLFEPLGPIIRGDSGVLYLPRRRKEPDLFLTFCFFRCQPHLYKYSVQSMLLSVLRSICTWDMLLLRQLCIGYGVHPCTDSPLSTGRRATAKIASSNLRLLLAMEE